VFTDKTVPPFLLHEPLQVQVSKSELPPVVLLHGFPDTPKTWVSLKVRLSKAGYKCYTPWLPGYSSEEDSEGVKSYANGNFSLANLTASLSNLISLILSQHTATKVHLIGHDWGSVIAQAYYLKNREIIKTLTLLAVPPGG
jgi:pimeloyl-ACP methyl ester carboxylesterase